MSKLPDAEALLEIGVIACVGTLLGGLALLIGGRLVGDVGRGRRHTEPPPDAGSVMAERRQHIASVSPR
jgi:hypothetical protein